ncbi:MAG: tyrosine-type recombinase/integrase [Porticoccus sp.]
MSKIMPFQPAATASPTAETGTVPNRKRNDDLRNGRKYLTPPEIDRILKVAKKGRHGVRDALMIRMGYLHGLRVSELVDLCWVRILAHSDH